ncbi:hypothetical protein ONZ43_g1149 [Nemania bipapillata]|uniref:Uncharacterized protein n=1 Tax=Nemania bipapillata TaxID=110536 RepID=A0ACC2J5N8_9PEZI|nr:hypothetical protein ONZ43_g1149 [Nemania bipapillata]
MHPAGYDGQPVDYHPYNSSSPKISQYCASQSFEPLDFLGEGFSYNSSPTSQTTPLSEQILTPDSDLPLLATGADYSPYLGQQQLQQGPPSPATPSAKRVFLTPPPSSYKADKTDNLFHSAVGNPLNWSNMSNSQQLNPPQFSWDAHANMANHNMGPQPPSYSNQLPRHMPSSTYDASSFHLQHAMGAESMGPASDATLVSHLPERSPVPSFHEESPHDKGDIGDPFQFDDDDTRNLHTPAGHPSGTDGTKTSIPYAQLLRKAFLSANDHKMKLQEIYQWFRDNTDKAKRDSKGWQNSIRHNLSMNAIGLYEMECKARPDIAKEIRFAGAALHHTKDLAQRG